jgi:nucleotide-binding universal stress UspA family protein
VTASVSDLAAVAEQAGLLVLGRRGASGQGVFRMGTISGELLREFRCPVLVCRDEQSERLQSSASSSRKPEVVAAVHVPAELKTVLRQAMQEAASRAMPLCVFSSGRTPSSPFLERALAAEKSVPWRLVWTAGVAAAEALLRYADPDDLLVLGNRGGGRLAGHVAESVTRAVLDDMPCDVMLVPL